MTSARETALPGVLILESPVYTDVRGGFRELWRQTIYAALGIPATFVQDNVSHSRRSVLRGLHLQCPGGQGKLVSALSGEVLDVAVDLRTDSPTYRAWVGEVLSAENGCQLYIPPGFGHGFVVLSHEAIVSYKCTTTYDRDADLTVRWDDPTLRIDWPIAAPILSDKDRAAPTLAEISPKRLPTLERT